MSLAPLVGHDSERRLLASAALRDSFPEALLLHGPPGVGKQRLALWAAQLLLCQRPQLTGPCDDCVSCRNAGRLEHPDLHWYFPVARPRGSTSPEKLGAKLEEARQQELENRRQHPLAFRESDGPTGLYLALIRSLRERAHKRPVLGDRQIFVLGDAEGLVPQEASPEAGNAMLKLLEEPPDGTRFILTSSEPGTLLETIRSRTVGLHLSPLSEQVVAAFLSEQLDVSPDDASRAAGLSRGSVGHALGYLSDDPEAPGPMDVRQRRALAMLQAVLSPQAEAGFATALSFPPARARALLPLLDALVQWLRDLAVVLSGASVPLPEDTRAALDKLVGTGPRPSPAAVAASVDLVQQAGFLAAGNVNPQLVMYGLLRDLRGRLVTGARTTP